MRPMTTRRDRAYVASTWGGSYRDYAQAGAIPSPVTRRHRVLIDRLLDAHGALVACLPGREETIHAWVCAEWIGADGREVVGGILHYVYVAAVARESGVARALIRHALGGYPERIVTSHPWPRKNARFCQKVRSAA